MLTSKELADRIAALDWSGTSLQHQLAMSAAVTALRGGQVEGRDMPLENPVRACDMPLENPVAELIDLLAACVNRC